MPRYQQAATFDLVRSVKNIQVSLKQLQIQSPGSVRKNLNQVTASLGQNGYFWGGDTTGWVGLNGTFAVVSDPPAGATYPHAGMYVNDGVTVGGGAMESANAPFPVTPLQQYLVTALVNSSLGSVQLGFDWQDSTHSFLAGPTNQTFTVVANTWTQLSAIQTAPLTAAYAYPRVGTPNADSSTTFAQAVSVTPVCVPGLWQDMRPLSNSFVGTITNELPPQYRLNADGTVEVAGAIQLPAAGAYNGITFFTFPAGYRSLRFYSWPVVQVGGAMSTDSNVGSPRSYTDSTGILQVFGISPAINSSVVRIGGRYPVNSPGLITI